MLEKRYRLLWQLAKALHKTQAKTLVAMALGLIGCGQMRSFALAGALARASGVRFKSALQRFYRWVHNDKLDDLACWSALAGRVRAPAGGQPLDRGDFAAVHGRRGRETRQRGLPIDQHGTGAAVPAVAAHLGAGKPQPVAQQLDQQLRAAHGLLAPASVDDQ